MGTKASALPVVGVDTGGTFTDLVMIDDQGVSTWKLPSTPDDPSRAVLEGIRHLAGGRPVLVFHGTTVATNALLEGKGARVALVTTEGFRDLLQIGRQNRPRLYDLHPLPPPGLISRQDCLEVRERILPGGEVEVALTEEEIARVGQAVAATGASSVAVCLLHSYANSVHERRLAEALQAAGRKVSLSSRILPEFREFERASTTAVNAAVSPVMESYLAQLQQGLGEERLRIMQSNGGAIGPATAAAEAVRTILSGPAGGIIGALAAAQGAGIDHLLTFDMGGTSTDVALCPGEVPFTGETVVAGWPVRVPMIDIHTVGAGGGSIARIDSGGALRVGPESAGADPGPACYGRGEQATVTDANLYLGRLRAEHFLGGRMRLDAGRSRTVIERLARQVRLSPQRLAEGIVEVAEATMAGALRVVSVARGHDPRGFVLLPFGGAGGLHACSLAEQLGMSRILIPLNPGLLSAVGLVLADVIRDYSRSVLGDPPPSDPEMILLFQPLEDRARAEMAAEGISPESLRLEYRLDLRYRGQSFEVTIPLAGNVTAAFHDRHEALYGYRDEARPVEMVTLRLRAIGAGPRRSPSQSPPTGDGGGNEHASVWLDGRRLELPLLHRRELPAGWKTTGPALIMEENASHLLRPGWFARVDARGNLMLERP